MWYGIAADLMVAVHFAYVAYVVVGQAAIMIAAPFKWQWARNPWFRFTHLAAIGYVAYEAIYHIRCPLTVWEEQLRALAGQTFRPAARPSWAASCTAPCSSTTSRKSGTRRSTLRCSFWWCRAW